MQRDPNVFDTAGRDVSAAGLLPVELELFIKPLEFEIPEFLASQDNFKRY